MAVATTSPGPRNNRPWADLFWKAGQGVVFGTTVALLVGLVYLPEFSLSLLWNLLIPVLPASFFITSRLWRGVCPLASANQWCGGLLRKTHLSGKQLALGNLVGLALLVILVPARRVILNEHGPVLAATIVVIVVLAAFLGALFDVRAGFCNSICPVFPVERLYGHHPLSDLDNRRCVPCKHCVAKGCLEVDQRHSLFQALHISQNSLNLRPWALTVYGAFAAGLPGFIVGYFTCENVDWTQAHAVRLAVNIYLWIAGFSLISFGLVTLTDYLLQSSETTSLALLAAMAGALYYWWAAPLIAAELRLPALGRWGVLAATYALVAFWLFNAFAKTKHRLRN